MINPWIVWQGATNSDYNLILSDKSAGAVTLKRVTADVPYTNTPLTFDFTDLAGKPIYNERTVVYTFVVRGDSETEMLDSYHNAIAWLISDTGYDELQDSDIDGWHYVAKCTDVSDLERLGALTGRFTATFAANPYLEIDGGVETALATIQDTSANAAVWLLTISSNHYYAEHLDRLTSSPFDGTYTTVENDDGTYTHTLTASGTGTYGVLGEWSGVDDLVSVGGTGTYIGDDTTGTILTQDVGLIRIRAGTVTITTNSEHDASSDNLFARFSVYPILHKYTANDYAHIRFKTDSTTAITWNGVSGYAPDTVFDLTENDINAFYLVGSKYELITLEYYNKEVRL